MKRYLLLFMVLIGVISVPLSAFAGTNNAKGLQSTTATGYGIIYYKVAQRPTTQLTMQLSYYNDGVERNKVQQLLSSANTGGFGFFINASNLLSAQLYVSGSYRTLNVPISTMSVGWHTITFSYNGSTIKLFVDGVEKGSQNVTGTIGWASGNVRYLLGADPDVNSAPTPDTYAGVQKYDDIRMYNRGLSANEIAYYWNRKLTGNETGLIGYYAMDDGTLTDSSPTKNDGLINTLVESTDTPNLLLSTVSAPVNVEATSGDGTSDITWDGNVSSENVIGYNVYVNSVKHNSSLISTTSYTASLSNNRDHVIQVTAVNQAGIESLKSQAADYTMFDTSPSAIMGFVNTSSNESTGTYSMKWDMHPDPDIKEYQIWSNGEKIGTVGKNVTSFNASNLSSGTTYNFTLRVIDNALNESPDSNVLTFVMPEIDVTPPEIPIGLMATPLSDNAIQLTWDAVSDIDLKGYHIYVNGIKKNAIPTLDTVYNVTGLTANTSYEFRVSAIDTNNNQSDLSSPVNGRTDLSEDVTAPSVVNSVYGVSGSGWIRVSWAENPERDVIGYNVYRDGVKVNNTPMNHLNYLDTNLVNGQDYTYTVTAVDLAGNESELSDPFTIAPDENGLPVLSLDYSLQDVAEGTSSWFGSVWMILAFVIGMGLSFMVARRVKELF